MNDSIGSGGRRCAIMVAIVLGLGGLVFLGRHYVASPRLGYPDAEWVGCSQRGSHSARRQPVRRIVFYTTEHPVLHSVRLWRDDPHVTGHYIVKKDGGVLQFISDSEMAYHAGNRAFNEDSIAVACEGYADAWKGEFKEDGLTEVQRTSLARLVQWLCARYGVVADRQHLMGKNQVPGVTTAEYPLSGPFCWGGAGNRYAPGAGWNWTELMERLGRKPKMTVLEVGEDTPVQSLPAKDAPVVSKLWAGQRVVAYDETESHVLVFVVGRSVEQPYLGSGEYHWDGWVSKAAVRASEGGIFTIPGDGTAALSVFSSLPGGNPVIAAHITRGKCFVVRAIQRQGEITWGKIDLMDPAPGGSGWINLGETTGLKSVDP
ncbi:MAG: peptidoglycan recognition family protein [Verrucomicrobia bacterium]|nr:peptidoglycan recognition family protein [Verrucomicrobiota bacterium]